VRGKHGASCGREGQTTESDVADLGVGRAGNVENSFQPRADKGDIICRCSGSIVEVEKLLRGAVVEELGWPVELFKDILNVPFICSAGTFPALESTAAKEDRLGICKALKPQHIGT